MIGYYNYTVVPTYFGLASSILGLYLALHMNHPFLAVMCLMFSGFCDMYDGKIARTKERTAQEKKFGIQIDSLSDLICFGVLPVAIGYSIGMTAPYFLLIAVFYVLTALIRLAYFNVLEEERQQETEEVRDYYTGLPVTSVALFLPLVYAMKLFLGEYIYILYAVALLVIGCLFVSKLKVKKPHGKAMYVILAIGLVELVLLIFCALKR